jgi:hypothetical protein
MKLGEKEWGGVDWNNLSPDRDRRWTLVTTVMNLKV